ncbi:sulfite exporter TauE/SafE family protein [Chloroflexota bacterium]
MIDTSLWFMFPVAVGIATIAMSAGIGGAVMFAPFFMLVLRLDPLIALGAGLAIEVFGFSSGVIGYWRKKAIHFDIVKRLIILTIPATIVGVILGRVFPVIILKTMLVLLILYLAYQFLLKGKECLPKDPRCTGVSAIPEKMVLGKTVRATSLLGGLLVGMISSGLGEVNELNFLQKMKMPVPAASGTSVFLVAMSAIVGVCAHMYFLVTEGDLAIFSRVLSLLIFTIPGVVLGAQVGVLLSNRVNRQSMGKFVGVLFVILAILTIVTILR